MTHVAPELVVGVVLVAFLILLVLVGQRPRTPVALPGGGLRWGSFELHEERDRIRWRDGGGVLVRTGSIDESKRTIYLETRFLGLPVSRAERPLGDFYRVAVTTSEERSDDSDYYRRRNELSLIMDLASGSPPPTRSSWSARGYHYTLALVDRRAYEHVLFTLYERPQEDAAQRLVGHLRERLERALGVPDRIGLGSPLLHAPKPNEEQPDAPIGARMTCPNCHKGYPLYITTCPACRVALFKDG